MGARNLDSVLHRFGSGGEEDGFRIAVEGRQGVQAFSELYVGLIGQDLEGGVRVAVELLANGGNHLRVTVPRVQHSNATGEVDVALALDVPYFRSFGACGEDRKSVSNATRYGGQTPLHQRNVAGHRMLPTE